jgi:hypothetical protein
MVTTSWHFAEFDDWTSYFSLVKGFVHTYYENGNNALLVRSRHEGHEELLDLV